MLLWSEPPQKVLRVAAGTQFRFLSQDSALAYLAILVELFRRRQEQDHEVPFDRLLEGLADTYQRFQLGPPPDSARLREYLDSLRGWDNIEQRLEPRRIVRITDRGLERYLFRLSDDTAAILLHLEGRLSEHREGGLRSARFSLREVDEALALVASLAETTDSINEVATAESGIDPATRAGSAILRAYRSVAEAGEELLLLDLKLSEATTRAPKPEVVETLARQMELYLERYLEDVEAIRRSARERLSRLMSPGMQPFLEAIRAAIQTEFHTSPVRTGAPPPDPLEVLERINIFLADAGTLDRRRAAVHQRLADLIGHIQRHVRAMVRRSQVRESLRAISRHMLIDGRLEFPPEVPLEEWFGSLLSSAHLLPDGCSGSSQSRALMPRPRRAGRPSVSRFSGAMVHPGRRATVGEGRALLELRMTELNQFVRTRVLRGRKSALASQADLDDFQEIRHLMAAVREGLIGPSPIRKRYLEFTVSHAGHDWVTLVPRSREGALCMLELQFSEVQR